MMIKIANDDTTDTKRIDNLEKMFDTFNNVLDFYDDPVSINHGWINKRLRPNHAGGSFSNVTLENSERKNDSSMLDTPVSSVFQLRMNEQRSEVTESFTNIL
jgi:hypothetical protein